jgi:hypothetical protein
MAYNTKTHEDAYSVYSHFFLSKGHVVVTGLGFGAREQWILSKPEVNKLTIIELNKSVIDYHYHIQSPLTQDPRVEILNIAAQDYKGQCDVMLADHYETETMEFMLDDAKKIHDTVNCKEFWFWPFEKIIMHSRKYYSDVIPPHKLLTKHESFNLLKQHYNFHKMPDFSTDQIDLFCMMHHSTVFSRSEMFLLKNCKDRNLFHWMYTSI